MKFETETSLAGWSDDEKGVRKWIEGEKIGVFENGYDPICIFFPYRKTQMKYVSLPDYPDEMEQKTVGIKRRLIAENDE